MSASEISPSTTPDSSENLELQINIPDVSSSEGLSYSQTPRTIEDLHQQYMSLQNLHAVHRSDYESDSDSDDDPEDVIRSIAKDDIVWFRGGGFTLNLGVSIFHTQVIIGLCTMAFCMYQLISNPSPENTNTYISLLSFTVGAFFNTSKDDSRKSKPRREDV